MHDKLTKKMFKKSFFFPKYCKTKELIMGSSWGSRTVSKFSYTWLKIKKKKSNQTWVLIYWNKHDDKMKKNLYKTFVMINNLSKLLWSAICLLGKKMPEIIKSIYRYMMASKEKVKLKYFIHQTFVVRLNLVASMLTRYKYWDHIINQSKKKKKK